MQRIINGKWYDTDQAKILVTFYEPCIYAISIYLPTGEFLQLEWSYPFFLYGSKEEFVRKASPEITKGEPDKVNLISKDEAVRYLTVAYNNSSASPNGNEVLEMLKLYFPDRKVREL
jgi:hypothetical protein